MGWPISSSALYTRVGEYPPLAPSLWNASHQHRPGEGPLVPLATQKVKVKVAQLYLTLCDPLDHSLPGSSVLGPLQARILEWVAVPFSRGPSQPRDQTRSPTLQADSLPAEPPGEP